VNARLLLRRTTADDGFTLIEALVALLVFAIISSGIVAGATTMVRMTDDSRSRVTAANLAAQEIDSVRAVANGTDTSAIYSITTQPSRSVPVNGRNYYVKRTATWISSAGASVSCNSATNLFELHVNVRVTWQGIISTDSGVQDDTLFAPTGASTTNALGAIAVSVIDSSGNPVAGITPTITVVPGSTGSSPAGTKPTTAEGCTYANGLKPGGYTVSIFRAGYRDPSGDPNPSKTVTVSAGQTVPVQFVYDQSGVINVLYDFGSSVTSAAVPAALPVNFTSTNGSFTLSTILASLFPSAYAVTAGLAQSGSKTCPAIDPAAWVSAKVNGVQLKAGVTSTVSSVVNVSSTVKVPLGVVLVDAPVGSKLTAIQTAPQGAGNPGCDVRSTLTYSVSGTGSFVALALPYGSWTISADGVPLAASAEQVVTNTALPGVSTDGTVTLDPRTAK
jgi:prepilin-type N-terminal cleavage/methylation domain-containing protein